jgi:hypothetical protein
MSNRALPLAVLALTLAACATAQNEPDSDGSAALERMLSGQSAVEGGELDAALAAADRHPLGSEANPVRAAMPVGQRAYLARLRCANGSAPAYDRQGSGGIGVYGNIIDFYAVTCPGAQSVTVVMDMYHAGYAEDRAVPGFTIAPR